MAKSKDTARQEFLSDLARVSGIATPTREDLARIDRTRKNKASNDDWENPYDKDAKIAKMKDGSTHLAHKAEHAVDMESGAVLAVTLQGADLGDTTTVIETIVAASENLRQIADDPRLQDKIDPNWMSETVADKGYHSNDTMVTLAEMNLRSYVAEPDHGRRVWADKAPEFQEAVYANRRRVRGGHGKRLMRQRGELIERSFAHGYETGAMRRTHLKRRGNIVKRLLIHIGGFNLGLVMRQLTGLGKPRRLQGLFSFIFGLFWAVWNVLARFTRKNAASNPPTDLQPRRATAA